jgi:hypothetical protein
MHQIEPLLIPFALLCVVAGAFARWVERAMPSAAVRTAGAVIVSRGPNDDHVWVQVLSTSVERNGRPVAAARVLPGLLRD